MSVMFIVLPLAFVLAGAAIAAFIWMVRGGQLDDLDTPPARMLFDDPPEGPASAGSNGRRPAPPKARPSRSA